MIWNYKKWNVAGKIDNTFIIYKSTQETNWNNLKTQEIYNFEIILYSEINFWSSFPLDISSSLYFLFIEEKK